MAVALLRRCEELSPDWDNGAVNEALISVEAALPEPTRAEQRFERALANGGGAAPYVALALAVALPQQDRERFRQLMEQSLVVAPGAAARNPVADLYAQARARFYLAHLDELFL